MRAGAFIRENTIIEYSAFVGRVKTLPLGLKKLCFH